MQPNSLVPLILALLLGACSALSPKTDWVQRADTTANSIAAWEGQQQQQNTLYLDQLIQSKPLNQLIASALANNPNLQATLLTLQIRQAEARLTSGQRLPDVNASLAANKQEDSESQYTGAISVSWALDLWHKLGDSISAAKMDAAQQYQLAQSARDTLVAEVMKVWLELIADQRVMLIQQQRLQTLQHNETFILSRYRKGLGSAEDLASARTSIASAQATLTVLEESFAQGQRSLRNLVGNEQLSNDLANIESLLSPADYPATQLALANSPAQTLQRRPDLRAAYLAIASADHQAKASYKDMLPSINLEAALTDIANSPKDALLTNPLWSVLGQLTAPLYKGGQLKTAAEIAELNTAIAYQSYRETLLNAVLEVENALGSERSLMKQQGQIETALNHARNNLAHYRNSYQSGLVTILDLLVIQQNTYDLEEQLDQVIFQRLSNRIDLGLALGLGVSFDE
ncbi:MAG: TolC family protein [Pseudomonadales bacterium]|nr:TolC family protein [Pseudomonadales bacterium]